MLESIPKLWKDAKVADMYSAVHNSRAILRKSTLRVQSKKLFLFISFESVAYMVYILAKDLLYRPEESEEEVTVLQ